MKIEKAQVNLAAQHLFQKKTTEKMSQRFWVGDSRPDFEGRSQRREEADQVTLSPAAQGTTPVRKAAKLDEESEMSLMDSLQATIIRMMVKAITGRDFKLFDPSELAKTMGSEESSASLQAVSQQQAQVSQSAGYGLEYDYYASHYEYEALSFAAEGSINTADGQTINFSVSMNISREFYTEQSFSMRAGDAKKIDPLVLNFDGQAAQLTETRFAFDLDSDGRQDQISWLKPGSAFLALDKNGDGVVNNGSELFGPATGDGFTELARYDEDGNSFIDAGDSIYDHLRLWMQGADGSQQLLALGQKGVGAIYVGHLAAPFELKDNNNNTQGSAVSAGFFLTESGTAGTVQQIDFVA